MSISIDSAGNVRVAVCEAFVATGLTAEYRAPGDSWVTFWDYSGTLEITSGTVLDSAALSQALEGRSTSPAFTAGGVITIYIKSDPESRGSLASFAIEDTEETRWINDDGSVATTPCP